ncbi:hypothetical protein FB561_5482 [Kribbella amoyensis]|uniref:Uncharacterized protein n=1 Tax=Kribbella amoyensis TaxID=996641 RepID=A0A561BZS0_9ACTN|nr:hypothetical protein [Kribbella amoyensis]TWD84307.1 hypothetical protein FB561_5482 [Kribbella amoyensis]
MSSFPAAARRVRDSAADPVARFWALRECSLHFPLYGFRATWHHVTEAAGVPGRLVDDPESLTRAVDELEEARRHWLLLRTTFAERRRREKAEGQRQPTRGDQWLSATSLAYCPDPRRHPDERLITVLHRLVDANLSEVQPQPACAVCGTSRPVSQYCTTCGVDPRGPSAALPRDLARELDKTWREIWRRTAQAPRLATR